MADDVIGLQPPMGALDLSAHSTVNLPAGSTMAGAAISSLGAGSVTNSLLAAGSVDATKIANGAVGNTQLAPNAVTSANIVNQTIVAADIANGTITNGQIASNTIINSNISNTAGIAKSKLIQSGNPNQFAGTANPNSGQTYTEPTGYDVLLYIGCNTSSSPTINQITINGSYTMLLNPIACTFHTVLIPRGGTVKIDFTGGAGSVVWQYQQL